MFRQWNTVMSMATDQAQVRRPPADRRGWQASLFALLISAFVAALSAIRPAAADENYQAAHGLGVYLGVLPAAIVRGHAETHPEGSMHGGAPRGTHQYHIVVAIFDAKTGARVQNAKVTANVSGLGEVGQQNIRLEPMLIAGTVSYGNFVALPGNDRYDIKLDIAVPERESPVRVNFTYQHQR